MAQATLTPLHLRNGIWEGLLQTGGEAAPVLSVTHQEKDVPGVSLDAQESGSWKLAVPIPLEAISDGVQTFLIQEAESGETLARFAIAAGAPLAEDLRAEVDLLRAELDMLKRAFRRHCVETGA